MKGRQYLNLAFLLTLALAVVAGVTYLQPQKLQGTVIDPPHAVQDFTLQSGSGPVSLSAFSGKVVVLYFGYTFCPDLCPSTLALLRQTVEELGDSAEDVQVIFISVDWKRDTPEGLAEYTAHFSPKFLGLTGTQSDIDAVTKDFGIFYLLNRPDQNGFYSVDHTADVRVLDRRGNLKLIWPYGTQPDSMAADLRILLKDSDGQ